MSFYEDASWLLIPSGIEEDVVFAQKPTSGLGDLSFTRASDATYTDSTGVVRRSPYNLVQYSEDFSNVAWAKTTTTVTSNTVTAPNGTLTADTLTASGGFPRVVQNSTIQANQSYRISVYAKAGTASVFTIAVTVNSVALVNFVQYDLLNGIVTGSGTMQPVGDGWYLCSATFTVGSSNSNPDIRFYSHAQGITGGWSGTNFIYGWGAQLVEGTSALDYFPTTNRQDVPRIDFRNADGTLSSCGRLLLEPQRTNSIRNSSGVGAVAGSPGTLPTNWDNASIAGLTRTVVDIGTENGLPYIDLRFAGTASSASLRIFLEAATQIAAVNGQTWSHSFYTKLIQGSANSYRSYQRYRDSGGVYLADSSLFNFTASSNLTRFNYERTISTATTAFVQPYFDFGLTIGQTYDFTIRIAAPQMELGAYATTWIPTTTAAVTRLADAASKTGVSSLIGQTEGTLFAEVDIKTLGLARAFICVQDLSFASNALRIECQSANQWRIQIIAASSIILDQTIVSPTFTTGIYKIALAYNTAAGGVVLAVNGTVIYTSASALTMPTGLDRIILGARFLSSFSFYISDGIAQAALFPTRLSNSELATLTTL